MTNPSNTNSEDKNSEHELSEISSNDDDDDENSDEEEIDEGKNYMNAFAAPFHFPREHWPNLHFDPASFASSGTNGPWFPFTCDVLHDHYLVPLVSELIYPVITSVSTAEDLVCKRYDLKRQRLSLFEDEEDRALSRMLRCTLKKKERDTNEDRIISSLEISAELKFYPFGVGILVLKQSIFFHPCEKLRRFTRNSRKLKRDDITLHYENDPSTAFKTADLVERILANFQRQHPSSITRDVKIDLDELLFRPNTLFSYLYHSRYEEGITSMNLKEYRGPLYQHKEEFRGMGEKQYFSKMEGLFFTPYASIAAWARNNNIPRRRISSLRNTFHFHRPICFELYILNLMKRCALLRLSKKLAHLMKSPAVSARKSEGNRRTQLLEEELTVSLEDSSELHKDTIYFKMRCGASEISSDDVISHYFNCWEEALGVRALLEEVNDLTEELKNFQQVKLVAIKQERREHLDFFLRITVLVASSIPVILGLDALFGLDPPRWVEILELILVFLAGVVFVIAFLQLMVAIGWKRLLHRATCLTIWEGSNKVAGSFFKDANALRTNKSGS